MTLKIGINGLGRIGRAILRITLERTDMQVVAVNDINPDIHNLAYLVKYDSTYGKLAHAVAAEGNELVIGNEKRFAVSHLPQIDQVPWEQHGVDVVVDASGVAKNLQLARGLKGRVRHCVATHAPAADQVDRTIIMGANHQVFDPARDFLIASSICDANALAPVVRVLDEQFGIEHGFLTTLHPWLNYQNLLDGPSISYATPGQIHDYYALGRASQGSLIPKTTSAVHATEKVLPQLKGKLLSMSYRIPTAIVSTADLSVCLGRKTSADAVKQALLAAEREQHWKTIHNSDEALVSVDFRGSPYSAIVDHRWIMMNDRNFLKVVLWYDNEWGYSYSVVELLDYLAQGMRG